MSEATLAIRQEEAIYVIDRESYSDIQIKPGEQLYLIALLEMPSLPGWIHENSTPYAVVAVQQYLTNGAFAWGWISITDESKEEIGDLLVDGGAEPGRWYGLLVSAYYERWQEEQ